MIIYNSSKASEFMRLKGSVAQSAFRWALPCSLIAVAYHHAINTIPSIQVLMREPSVSETTGWTLFTSILGFLIVFRAQMSYARYWEGLTLLERACGVWLNACSNLIAFSSAAPELQEKVDDFQYLMSRYMSLLVSHSMSDVSKLSRSRYPTLSLEGVDPKTLAYLDTTSAKENVLLQWVQRLIVEGWRTSVIDIPAPILTRVFQEFSIGHVHVIDARKIAKTPFPFAFAQMVWLMLAFFSILPVPMICAVGMDSSKAAVYTFLIVFVFWSVHHIAVEIEMPFGDDPNDLPLDDINHRFNKVLERLLEMRAQQTLHLVHRPATPVRFLKHTSTISAEDQPAWRRKPSEALYAIGHRWRSTFAAPSSPTQAGAAAAELYDVNPSVDRSFSEAGFGQFSDEVAGFGQSSDEVAVFGQLNEEVPGEGDRAPLTTPACPPSPFQWQRRVENLERIQEVESEGGHTPVARAAQEEEPMRGPRGRVAEEPPGGQLGLDGRLAEEGLARGVAPWTGEAPTELLFATA
mmetsp:Transcript_109623/g.306528  ORF Transcript_109623/g.306528 Transcript_109623/m.306528 type:complete len:520 (-) Transcript_109623:528-2087(-)